MEKYYLGKFKINWADELDVKENIIMTSIEIDKLNEYYKKYDGRETSISVGTNQCIEDITSNEVLDKLEYKEISSDAYEELKKTKLIKNGLPSIIEDMIEYFEEEDEYGY